MKIALCQMKVSSSKDENLRKASIFIEMAKKKQADIIVLPEMFNSPYDETSVKANCERAGGNTWTFLKEASKDIILIGGSIPEEKEGRIYNTTFTFEDGKEIGSYRKMNLFDVEYDGLSFHESDFITPGQHPLSIDTSLGKIGIAICFDLRFPELFRELEQDNPFLYLIPAAFNHISGPAHYELLGRARALDTQSYLALCSPASSPESSYDPYGHSMVIDPWGKVLSGMDEEEGLLLQEIEKNYVNEIRRKLPIKKKLII